MINVERNYVPGDDDENIICPTANVTFDITSSPIFDTKNDEKTIFDLVYKNSAVIKTLKDLSDKANVLYNTFDSKQMTEFFKNMIEVDPEIYKDSMTFMYYLVECYREKLITLTQDYIATYGIPERKSSYDKKVRDSSPVRIMDDESIANEIAEDTKYDHDDIDQISVD